MTEKVKISPDQLRIPKGYDFSNKYFKSEDYEGDYILRTDAVWEKTKLKDWFRQYMKVFYYCTKNKRYQVMEPEDLYTVVFEPWALEDLEDFVGYTATGRTNSFQVGLGPKESVAYSNATQQTRQDYYDLCALRFENWFKCDNSFSHLRHEKFDFVKDRENYKTYPCYKEFYETIYACQDDLFDFLMEVAYTKKARNFHAGDFYNIEIKMFPNVFDNPDKGERRTYTY